MGGKTFSIYCNAKLTDSAAAILKAGVGAHRLLMGQQPKLNLLGGAPDPLMDQADIVFGQPDVTQALKLPNLKWIHLTTAGYTRYDTSEFAAAMRQRSGTMTNSSSVYDEPCAEHALAFMLCAARRIGQNAPTQWNYQPMRSGSRLLVGQTALLVGFGAIARRLAEMLAPMRMNLIGLRRNPRGDEPIAMRRISQIDELLPQADHVMNILPASSETNLFFDANRFAKMKTGCVFYNIGRGSTVDQGALRQALESGHLSAAWIDVTTPEPLPADDPLWKTKNCFITPHTAGGFDDEFPALVRHFLGNLQRYERGEPLMDRVY
ncbi:MAG TPA: D-2-hydroxyacid dehydrogenase [Tepidisphaeraceae bacterium]|nr:D-2-hydroxyacid dehydrogenase [Tepidisphaeraceae bacterium]